MQKLKINKFIVALALFLCLTFLLSSCAVGEEEKKTVITIFSWEDYIDEGYDEIYENGQLVGVDECSEVLTDTLQYSNEELSKSLIEVFEEQNPDIKVNYYSFATNEEMYAELNKDKSAVNLICPSEYMIMKMKEEDLIKAFDVPNNYKQNVSPYITQVFDGLGLNTNDGKTYAIGYMWGTMGLIYNAEKYSDEDFESWTDLYDQTFSGKLTIKDSLRDSYILALAIVYKDELLALDKTAPDYNQKLTEIFNRTDEETIVKAEQKLRELKPSLYGFEVDAGKTDLLTGKIDVNFAWSGDAVYAMYEGEPDEETGFKGKKLGYVVPQEGSNVWFDGFVMTKATEGAEYDASLKFLDFLSEQRSVVRNMEYVGYTPCVAGEEVFEYVVENFGDDEGDKTVDLGYFFGEDGDYNITVSTGECGYANHLYAQYADKETLERCAVMNHFNDEQLERLTEMWNDVKLIKLSNYFLIAIVVCIALIVLALVAFKYKDKWSKKVFKFERKNKNSENYKVVEILKR